ncbi:MAG: hypothetical protein K9N07_06970 [Candidatus Cloacimonetes bacterium]|nr:hypothetical protein [Candidatus Cloacimonadota bacterium]
MNWKAVIVVLLFFTLIFCHYSNQHKIIVYGRQLDQSREYYQAQKVKNQDLVTTYSKLSSRERIQDLASSYLGMYYDDNNENVHNIKYNNKKETFRLIDYIVPSAEALTR